ncbi:MAG: hypothetical protein JF886_10845 [Candidatus Dormibacteraeota bacterium]|uniref:Uncharacterized protein n=1 Tax=Candidatus Aeolococcus gillhamiae TaxID=3127015 RepID=A0A2W5Z2S7_9BACT|nr:hypothetical protein [Candidatus Dormibacteraeota bacterium]PZR79520.1 MAG: hypothetical protein DLM65_10590 [Candidatus Dormibacter sp. RRmetagenome_bin12]
MIERAQRRRRAAALLVTALTMAACGSASAGLDAASLGLPVTGTAVALATATVSTSPDGGIYRNPDHLEVMLVGRHSVDAVAAQLGNASSSWSQLRGLGQFTLVAMRIRDDGKVTSDPQLFDLQMASDYAPPGTANGPLRHFYHPTYPLAVVADSTPGDSCSIHLDPGHSGVAILVYPPVNLPTTLVWGRLGDFVLSVPVGGALPPLAGPLHAEACSRSAGAPA